MQNQVRRRNMLKDERGITPIAGFAIIMMLLAAMYTYYQVYGVPKICSGYEVRHFADILRDIISFSGEVERTIFEGRVSAVNLKLGGSYPEVPFFSTPNEFSGMISMYSAEVRIENAVAVDTDLQDVWDGSEMVWTGSSLIYRPSTIYFDPGQVQWEYGIVAVGKSNFSCVGGTKIIDGRMLYIPLLYGNLSESGLAVNLYLYPYSGGGQGIEVTENGLPITISFKTSLPFSFWQEYFDSLNNPYISSVTSSGDYVVITLMRGVTYKLYAGVASFSEDRASQHYLYRVSSKATTTPAVLAVEVRDSFNNPVPNIPVTFTSLGGTTTLSDGTNSGTSLTVRSNDLGIASVVAVSATGSDVVSASITRPDGSTYEVAFTIYG